jgi:hypothetical protein
MSKIKKRLGQLAKLAKRIFGYSNDDRGIKLLPATITSSGKGAIINPKSTSAPSEVIKPTRYRIAHEDSLSVVRPHDYINIRPPKEHAATGGGK